ncbi:MAG: methyltransferase domain-containing protein [Deltaproteobacteria bacterium]|nr:methyltransferase domain-containing protein [Deltaproteobacteria bacterium]
MDVLEVGGSLSKGFVLDELQVNSWTGMESPEYATEVKKENKVEDNNRLFGSTLPDVEKNDIGFHEPILSRGAYTVFYANIEELPEAHYEKYDRIFSIAAFEHILKFPFALRKMYAALKPGGKLFTMFSPIWSSHNGHHLLPITDRAGKTYTFNNSPIPPWGHLLMRPAELYDFLRHRTDEETSVQLVYFVYTSPHINRFFTEDYAQFVQQSPFNILRLEATFPVDIQPDVQQHLQQLYPGREHFANNGILMVLERT